MLTGSSNIPKIVYFHLRAPSPTTQCEPPTCGTRTANRACWSPRGEMPPTPVTRSSAARMASSPSFATTLATCLSTKPDGVGDSQPREASRASRTSFRDPAIRARSLATSVAVSAGCSTAKSRDYSQARACPGDNMLNILQSFQLPPPPC